MSGARWTPSRRPAVWVAGAGLVVTALVSVALAGRSGDEPDAPAPPPAIASATDDRSAAETAPSTDTDTAGAATPGSTAGRTALTREGDPSTRATTGTTSEAVAAAIDFASAPQEWLYLDDASIADAVSGMATEAASDDLAADVVGRVQAAREQLAQSSGRVWWLVHPLAWRVASRIDDEAVVEVWSVTLLAATGIALPQAEWVTATVELVWDGASWRVDGTSERPGPTPLIGPNDHPWTSESFDDALDGFTRLEGPQR